MINCDHCIIAEAPLRERPTSNCYAVFGLVGVLGVLAFIFSAVSPDDDDIQQEFVQGSKTRQVVVQNFKSIPSIRVLINSVHYVFVPQGLTSLRCSAIERVRICDPKIGATIFRSRTGDRSPPATSSCSSLNS